MADEVPVTVNEGLLETVLVLDKVSERVPVGQCESVVVPMVLLVDVILALRVGE